MIDGVLAYTAVVATGTAEGTGWRRLTPTLMTAGGGRYDEGGTPARFRSFLWKQVSVGVGKRWENKKCGKKVLVGRYKKYPHF